MNRGGSNELGGWIWNRCWRPFRDSIQKCYKDSIKNNGEIAGLENDNNYDTISLGELQRVLHNIAEGIKLYNADNLENIKLSAIPVYVNPSPPHAICGSGGIGRWAPGIFKDGKQYCIQYISIDSIKM